MDLQLNDKTALVTGLTAGIGFEIARKLAVEGATGIVTGRNKAKLDEAVDSIRASGGAKVSGTLADAATEEGADVLVRAAPRVDISILYAPRYLVGEALQVGQLVTVLGDYVLPPLTVHALYPHGRHLSAKVRAFVDFLAQRFGSESWDNPPPP